MKSVEWLALAGVMAVLLLGMPLIRWLGKRFGASPEVARKSIHVGMGLVCASLPWVFDRPLPVVVLAAIATVPLALIRILPVLKTGVGSALHSIERPSYGEILFAPAVALVFVLAGGDRQLYQIPVLILTIADAAGALVGTRWGKRRYGSGEGFKTVEGSVIFGLIAFLCGFLPLLQCGRVDVAHAFWIGAILALLAMMAEGISDRGFDNLVLPVGCFLVLQKLLPLEMLPLISRGSVLVGLLALVMVGSRWSTLNGGALLGSVLLGYGCAVIADWRFALPPLAVFVCHVVTTRRHQLTGRFDHRLDAVLSHTLACLPWVLAADLRWVPPGVALAGISFGMGAQLAILDTATRACLPDRHVTPLRSPLKGFLVATMSGLVWLAADWRNLWMPSLVALGAMVLATLLFRVIRSNYRGHITGLWIIQGLLALAASLPALLSLP